MGNTSLVTRAGNVAAKTADRQSEVATLVAEMLSTPDALADVLGAMQRAVNVASIGNGITARKKFAYASSILARVQESLDTWQDATTEDDKARAADAVLAWLPWLAQHMPATTYAVDATTGTRKRDEHTANILRGMRMLMRAAVRQAPQYLTSDARSILDEVLSEEKARDDKRAAKLAAPAKTPAGQVKAPAKTPAKTEDK